MPKVYIDSKMYHYSAGIPEQEPEGAIIFVHGAGGNCRHWSFQVPSLGRNMLTLAVDLPGHGLSEGRPADEISHYADFIYRFAEHVAGPRFFLAGHSMGGAIAMDFALRFPKMLSGLILVGTGARLRVAPAVLDTFQAGKRFLPLIDLLYGPDTPDELVAQAREEMLQTAPEVYYNDFVACNNFDIMQQVRDITVPALVLGASEDRLTPVKYSQYLSQQVKDSRLAIIEGAGHMMMMEKPKQLNSHIEQFTASTSAI